MSVALVTGAGGLVGSEMAEFLVAQDMDVVGIDNDMRAHFFGDEASTRWRVAELGQRHRRFRHETIDMRDAEGLQRLCASLGNNLGVVVHAAAQPSHDWAAREPFTDFGINAVGTLNLLEAVRRHAPKAAFVFLSTNKVYGDRPNQLPLEEKETRWEIRGDHAFFTHGIDESMSIDQCTHSLFGASKLSADILVQEYGRYFGMNTVCFRGGCLTGGGHSGSEQHGFLAYLMKCAATGSPYRIYGYKGKQVRDNLHARDLIKALWCFVSAPRPGRVYNIGGGRRASCSVVEAIALCEQITDRPLKASYEAENRIGDHIWWISDISAFCRDYPDFHADYDLAAMLRDIYETGLPRWTRQA